MGFPMSQFVESLQEVFAAFGAVSARRMFGGHGLFHEGLMFGLVADDVLYLKADEASLAEFERAGSSPFVYESAGKKVAMSYYLAPETVFDDPEEARRWAALAYEAARRTKRPKAGSKKGA